MIVKLLFQEQRRAAATGEDSCSCQRSDGAGKLLVDRAAGTERQSKPESRSLEPRGQVAEVDAFIGVRPIAEEFACVRLRDIDVLMILPMLADGLHYRAHVAAVARDDQVMDVDHSVDRDQAADQDPPPASYPRADLACRDLQPETHQQQA